MTERFLSGRDFKIALAVFSERGIGEKKLCELLECSDHQPRRWREIGAPRYIALALTALLEGLSPWMPERRKK